MKKYQIVYYDRFGNPRRSSKKRYDDYNEAERIAKRSRGAFNIQTVFKED